MLLFPKMHTHVVVLPKPALHDVSTCVGAGLAIPVRTLAVVYHSTSALRHLLLHSFSRCPSQLLPFLSNTDTIRVKGLGPLATQESYYRLTSKFANPVHRTNRTVLVLAFQVLAPTEPECGPFTTFPLCSPHQQSSSQPDIHILKFTSVQD